MWIVKYVELDDIFNYYPVAILCDTEEKSIECYREMVAIAEEQQDMDKLSPGKIISEIYREEI